MCNTVEITEADNDSGSTQFHWELLTLCGDPADEAQGTYIAGFNQSRVSRIVNSDDLAFNRQGNLLIATVGQPRRIEINGGIFFVPTQAAERGFNRELFSGVIGADSASVIMNSSQDLMLVSIQYPGGGWHA